MNSKIKKIIPVQVGNFAKSVFLSFRGVYYRGNNYYCPVCNKSYRKFLPGGFDLPVIKEKEIIGGGYRENNICPGCISTDRDRLVFLYLQQKTDFFQKNNKVLHIAPEPSLYTTFIKLKNLEYIAGTKYLEGFYYSKKLISLDITSLRFDDNTFNYIIANHILEHIEDDLLAMREIYRTLKPGGTAILQVPIALKLKNTYENSEITTKKEREEHFGQFDHVRLYGADYKKRLENAGFKVLKIKPGTKEWALNDIERYGLNKNEYLYIALK